jgi:hypothetical protein
MSSRVFLLRRSWYAAKLMCIGIPTTACFFLQHIRKRYKISFTVGKNQQVQLSVFDIQDKRVEHLFQGTAEAGKSYQFQWNAGSHPSGIYISRLVTQKEVMTQKIVLLSGGNR